MKKIIDKISEFIEDWAIDYLEASPENDVKSWGFVELVRRESKGKTKTTTQPIPMTITGTSDRKQVSLNDKFKFISWIRWVSPAQSYQNLDDQWGLKTGKRKRLPIRIVIAHKVELGEDLVFDLAAALPESLVINGFDLVYLNQYGIDPDHESIYRTELGETVYELHRFPWNLYTINLDVEFIEGPECPDDEYVEYDNEENVLHDDMTPVEYV